MTNVTTKTISLADVRALAKRVLVSGGMDERGSDVIADLVTMCERDGPRSHGLAMLPRYVQSFESGYANGAARPSVEKIAPGVLRGDGDNGYFQIASDVARPKLIELARENGIAGFTCANTHHLSGLRFETEALANEGLVAMCVVNSLALIVPHGGNRPVFGTNPMSFACPREGDEPIVWDQSSSVVALMDIKLAAAEGHDLDVPGGLDRAGNITTDAAEISQTLSLLPFAEHKGTCIAMMVEIMGAALAGGTPSIKTEEKESFGSLNVKPGVTTIAIDPHKWGNPGFLKQIGQMVEDMCAAPGVRVPGDGRLQRRATAKTDGIVASAELLAQLGYE
ncbi:MAG: Ldh family oxidoreductase [Pseudomonadota bacterium]